MEAPGLRVTLLEALKRIDRCWTNVKFRATVKDTMGTLQSEAPQFLFEKEPSDLLTGNVFPDVFPDEARLKTEGRTWIAVEPIPVTLYLMEKRVLVV